MLFEPNECGFAVGARQRAGTLAPAGRRSAGLHLRVLRGDSSTADSVTLMIW
jgi:hypothetical protein